MGNNSCFFWVIAEKPDTVSISLSYNLGLVILL